MLCFVCWLVHFFAGLSHEDGGSRSARSLGRSNSGDSPIKASNNNNVSNKQVPVSILKPAFRPKKVQGGVEDSGAADKCDIQPLDDADAEVVGWRLSAGHRMIPPDLLVTLEGLSPGNAFAPGEAMVAMSVAPDTNDDNNPLANSHTHAAGFTSTGHGEKVAFTLPLPIYHHDDSPVAARLLRCRAAHEEGCRRSALGSQVSKTIFMLCKALRLV